jgi:hypothetical protein
MIVLEFVVMHPFEALGTTATVFCTPMCVENR